MTDVPEGAASDAPSCRHTEHAMSGDGLVGRYFDEDFQAYLSAPSGHWEPCPVEAAKDRARLDAALAKHAGARPDV